jgi:HlyD family secretion protein
MSQKSKKKWIWIGAIVVVLIGVVWFVKGRKKEKVPEITVAPVTRTKLVSKVSSNGQIEAKRKVDLSANVPGQIVNLAVREGDTVQKGDFLLQIDQTQLAATAKGAEASLKALFHDRDAARATAEQARRNYTRAKQSFADELIPQSDLDSAQAAVDSADAQLEAAERRIDQARANLAGARDTLSKTKMIAPMSGTVTRLPVEEGEVAVIGTMNNPGTVLMTISDMSIVEAVMEVDETDIPYVKLGQDSPAPPTSSRGRGRMPWRRRSRPWWCATSPPRRSPTRTARRWRPIAGKRKRASTSSTRAAARSSSSRWRPVSPAKPRSRSSRA